MKSVVITEGRYSIHATLYDNKSVNTVILIDGHIRHSEFMSEHMNIGKLEVTYENLVKYAEKLFAKVGEE